mgnify:CR=1 FL=1
MNKLRTIVFLLFVSLVSTPSYAGSEDFGGVYIGISGSAMGGELDGKYTDSSSEVTKGTGGFVESPIAGLDLGYNMALGESMVVGLGMSWTPGDAIIGKADYLIVLWDSSVLKGGGTHGEVTIAHWVNKPIYLVNRLPLEDISSWIFSCSSRMYDSVDHLKNDLLKIYRSNK